jgi:hypothetical protein
MTPDQAITLLSVKDWPPQLEHWPPKDKDQWKPGMSLVGRIESVMTLPRPDGSPRAGEPYTALYVRREGDRRLVMFHGWHTAAEDLDGMHPAPGLLFAAYYRGSKPKAGGKGNAFEDFKYLVTPYDPQPAAQQARQAGGRPAEAPPRQAPEGEVGASASPSGSNGRTEDFGIELPPITNTDGAKAYIKGQRPGWQRDFQRLADAAKEDGSLADLTALQKWVALITRTWAAQGVVARQHRDEAA